MLSLKVSPMSPVRSNRFNINIYIYILLFCIYIYNIYIFIKRERERDRDRECLVHGAYIEKSNKDYNNT